VGKANEVNYLAVSSQGVQRSQRRLEILAGVPLVLYSAVTMLF